MEYMSSLWSYQENIDELNQKLIYTSLELESVRAEANEEKRKSKENQRKSNQLLQLVETVIKERDEAKDQLQKLLNKLILPSTSADHGPLLINSNHTKANSSITESNSFSDTYVGNGSSPVNSFLDAASSPELLSNVKQPFKQDFSDEGSLVIEKIMEGKPLPEKGKFMQALLEAGPLLQTLMVTGPLPRWRNPPPLQPLQLPPISIDKVSNMKYVPRLLNSSSSSLLEMNCGSSQMLSTNSMVNFGGGFPGSCLGSSGHLIADGINANNYVSPAKRHRIQ